MTVGNRIKELRKELKINQTEFGKKIGLKQTAIGMYENNLRKVADRTVLLICREFGVSEEWLCNGSGEMFVPMSQDERIIALTARLLDNQHNFKKALLMTILEMTEEEEAALKFFIQKLWTQID